MDDSPTQQTIEEESQSSGIGPIAGIVIVVMLLALGGLYFLLMQEVKLHQTVPSGQAQVNS